MFAESSLVLTVTHQDAHSSGNRATRVSKSESFGFTKALDSALIKPAEDLPSVSLKIVQTMGSLPSEKLSQTLATRDAAVKISSISEVPSDLSTRVSGSEMPTSLEILQEALGSLKGILKQPMMPGFAAPDVETIFGKFTKAASEFDLDSGETLLAALKADQQAFPGFVNNDWSLIHSGGETDQAATFNLLNLIDWTLDKVKSLNPVVEENNRAVLSLKPGNTEITPTSNINFSSAGVFQVAENPKSFTSRVTSQKAEVVGVFNRTEAPAFTGDEVSRAQPVSYVAESRSNPSSVLGMTNDQPVKAEDMVARTPVSLTSNGSRESASGGWTLNNGNTDRLPLMTAQGSRALGSALKQVEYALEDQNSSNFAVTKPKPEIASGKAQDLLSKAQDLAVRSQVLPTSSINQGAEITDVRRNVQAANQSSSAEPFVRLDPALQADVLTIRSVDRPSGRRLSNGSDAVDFDPRTQASLAMAGARPKPGIQAPFSALSQYNQIIANPSEFGIADSSLFREGDILTTPELGQNGLLGGFPAAEVKTERSTLLPTQASRPTGFSIALTEQMRGITARDGVTKVQLSPRGLGTIEVEVATDVDNTTNIVIRSDNSVVLSALKDVRDLVSQVLNLDTGGTLHFEESTGQGDTQSGEDTRDQELDVDVSQSRRVTSGDVARSDVISGDVLDIIA